MKMQKTLSLIIALLMLVSAFAVFSVPTAADDMISEEEAKELYRRMIGFYYLNDVEVLNMLDYNDDGGLDGRKYVYWENEEDPEPDLWKFYPAKEEYSTLDKMLEVARGIYTDDLAPKTFLPNAHPDDYIIYDGKICVFWQASWAPANWEIPDNYDSLKKTDKGAVIHTKLYEGMGEDDGIDYTLTLVKTKDGWRISGGTLIDTIYASNLKRWYRTPDAEMISALKSALLEGGYEANGKDQAKTVCEKDGKVYFEYENAVDCYIDAGSAVLVKEGKNSMTLLVNICSAAEDAAAGERIATVLRANVDIKLVKSNGKWMLEGNAADTPTAGEHTNLYIISGISALALAVAIVIYLCIPDRKRLVD